MSDPADLYNDPEFRAWAGRVRAHLIPPLRDSALTLSLVPAGDTDIKFAVELGLSIMLDKPIIAIVQPGTKVSERLVRVADAIVEAHPGDPDGQRKIIAAIEEAIARIEAGDSV